jgi:hypothetical protein
MTPGFSFRFTATLFIVILYPATLPAQQKWINVDSAFQPLPDNFHVYKTTDNLDGKPFIAYYVKAKLKDKGLEFTDDTTLGRRFTPSRFYEKNDKPLLVVNCTFFNFDKNQNLNTVIKNGKLVGYNIHSIPMRGKDTFQYRHPLASAIGINKKGEADIAWLLTDSSKRFAYASQLPMEKPIKDSVLKPSFQYIADNSRYFYDGSFIGAITKQIVFKKWKMRTAVGGGPVIVQNGQVKITNNEELKFAGNAINDKHPRTCIGYTNDGYLIIMVIQGRFPGIAEGATLEQEAQLLVDLGCIEALNLDGGGSSCMLVNGKETIKPSDRGGQRPVPAVFIISKN